MKLIDKLVKKLGPEMVIFLEGYLVGGFVGVAGSALGTQIYFWLNKLKNKKIISFMFKLPITDETSDIGWNYKLNNYLKSNYDINISYPKLVGHTAAYYCETTNKDLYEKFKNDAQMIEVDSEKLDSIIFLVNKDVKDMADQIKDQVFVNVADWAKPFFNETNDE